MKRQIVGLIAVVLLAAVAAGCTKAAEAQVPEPPVNVVVAKGTIPAGTEREVGTFDTSQFRRIWLAVNDPNINSCLVLVAGVMPRDGTPSTWSLLDLLSTDDAVETDKVPPAVSVTTYGGAAPCDWVLMGQR